jgi:hypothetical protein
MRLSSGWTAFAFLLLSACSGSNNGNDAGPTDAGPTDAGPTDAGPTDAGYVDAGPNSQYGNLDAGLHLPDHPVVACLSVAPIPNPDGGAEEQDQIQVLLAANEQNVNTGVYCNVVDAIMPVPTPTTTPVLGDCTYFLRSPSGGDALVTTVVPTTLSPDVSFIYYSTREVLLLDPDAGVPSLPDGGSSLFLPDAGVDPTFGQVVDTWPGELLGGGAADTSQCFYGFSFPTP